MRTPTVELTCDYPSRITDDSGGYRFNQDRAFTLVRLRNILVADCSGLFGFHGNCFHAVPPQCCYFAAGQGLLGVQKVEKLDGLGHDAGPAGLMAGAKHGAGVAVKVFMEEDEVAPVGIGLELLRAAVNRSSAVFVLQSECPIHFVSKKKVTRLQSVRELTTRDRLRPD